MAKLSLKEKLAASGLSNAATTPLSQFDNELFGSPCKTRKEELVYLAPELLIGDFPQRYRMLSPEELDALAKDILVEGITDPLLVRPHPTEVGHYQIIAGRNRKKAGVMAGLTELPCQVKNLDDTRAQLAATSTNLLRRKNLLPSELAYGYKMQQDSLVALGKCATPSELAQKNGTYRKDIYRYLQLTKLCDPLLEAVDNKRVPVLGGVELSYLSPVGQDLLADFLEGNPKLKLSIADAKVLREAEELTTDFLENYLLRKDAALPKPKLDMKTITSYLPKGLPPDEWEEYLINALQFYEDNSH